MQKILEKFREESLKKFESMPSEKSEIFKHQTMFKDFEEKLEKQDVQKDSDISILEKPDGVIVKDLAESKIENLLARFDLDDKFVQMNNAFFSSGMFIEIPKDKQVQGILRISSAPQKNFVGKIIVVANEGSKLNVVKESYSSDKEARIISEDVLIIAKEGSTVGFSELQNCNQSSKYFSNKIAACDKDSKVVWNLGIFGGSQTRSRTYNFLEGDGSYAEDLQLIFGNNEQQFDTFSNLIHIGKSTTAKSLAKGAFTDRSSSIAKGMIKIREKAKNASSYLACHGILLSKSAKANAIPSLEIETNEVKATHSASVSPIDEEKVFYLKVRGISAEEARKMITLGFFDPLIRSIESGEIRAKMRWLIETKWKGEDTKKFDEKRLKEFAEEDAIKRGDIFEGHYKYR